MIYVVINPITDSLERELSLLEKGNLTWRSNTNRCEYIRTIQEYVDSRQWPNYEDFLYENENAIFLKTFSVHDDDLKKVNSEAENLYKWLLSWDEFSRGVSVSLDRYEQQRAAQPGWPSFYPVRKELDQMVAENLINNIKSMPTHYTYSFFWNFIASEHLQVRHHSQFSSLFEAQAELREISSALKGGLEDHRLNLSRKYDVPAAPVPGLPNDF
ncbi:MAG: hypothetical protein ACHQT6_03515 [Candidatus Acidiferrales bacterium]